MTYTTRYFGGDRLVTLKDAYLAIHADFDKRRPFLDSNAASAMELRLDLLRHAISLLAEPVPRAFGG